MIFECKWDATDVVVTLTVQTAIRVMIAVYVPVQIIKLYRVRCLRSSMVRYMIPLLDQFKFVFYIPLLIAHACSIFIMLDKSILIGACCSINSMCNDAETWNLTEMNCDPSVCVRMYKKKPMSSNPLCQICMLKIKLYAVQTRGAVYVVADDATDFPLAKKKINYLLTANVLSVIFWKFHIFQTNIFLKKS